MDDWGPLFRNRYRIPSARLRGWDYRRSGIYFVTICVKGRDRCLGEVTDGRFSASRYGDLVAREWQEIPGSFPRVKLDAWIVMPDHIHGLLALEPAAEESVLSLGVIIGQFKSNATKAIRMSGYRVFSWQERFHDRVIRDQEELETVRAYILENPRRWALKREDGAFG